ncbi:uncharacterized protein LOC143019371 [Oratosquilla oratoria]|uniref:uncharacterized protein LOC143019371 n=1 Tax=Oratosquilla oratoria TaxID=337810 RepID=UPI003F7759E5
MKSSHLEKASCKKKNQRQSLVKCLEEQVCPKFFGFYKYNHLGFSFPSYIKEFLKERIKLASLESDAAYLRVRSSTRTIKLLCPDDLTYKFLSRLAIGKVTHISDKHSVILSKKLTRLCNNSVWSKFSLTDNVVNISNLSLTHLELEVLGLGISFAMKPSKHQALDYIAGFDKFLASNEYDKDLLCLKGVLLQGIMNCFSEGCGLPKRYKTAVENLSRRKDVIITKADIGGKIVIINESDYKSKVFDLLEDRETYEQLTKNPLKSTVTDFNKQARKIVGNEFFNNNILVMNPQLPNFYSLPKIHKEGTPLRPIISNRNSCTNRLSKWLTRLLSPFVGTFSNSHIKHSEDFINKIKHHNIPANSKLLSLDIVSLFTNVNTD